jgi:hypothetical protein
LFAVGLYQVLLEKDVEKLYANYVLANYQSEGAMVRALMNAVPAAIFLTYRKRFQLMDSEARLWTWFALISLALPGLLVVTTASTAVDRMALYMLPLQVAVFAHMPSAFGTRVNRHQAPTAAAKLADPDTRRWTIEKEAPGLRTAILLYYGMVLFVWLNFGTHAVYWLPYRFYPLESSF